MKILVSLHKDRNLLGKLELVDQDGVVKYGPVSCLAKSDNDFAIAQGNPLRDPLKRGGDTPTGGWIGTPKHFMPPVDESTNHSYGPFGKIVLSPMSGDAIVGLHNGRSGILIHSGDLTATGAMRPTHGCIRLSNQNMLDLLTCMGDQQAEVEVAES